MRAHNAGGSCWAGRRDILEKEKEKKQKFELKIHLQVDRFLSLACNDCGGNGDDAVELCVQSVACADH